MDNTDRRMTEGWIDKAHNQLQAARGHLASRVRWSETIEASQESIELSVKSILSLLRIDYSLTHGWNAEALAGIAEQIRQRDIVPKLRAQNLYWGARLPRLLILTNLWAQFYLAAKYGLEAGKLAPPQELFEEREAQLAVRHAEECCSAANELRYLPQHNLAQILGP